MDVIEMEKKANDGNCDAKVGPAGAQDERMETTEKSDLKEKKTIMQNPTTVKKAEKSKVVQSRKHSVRSSLVKPLHIIEGGKVEEIERLLEDFLKETWPEKENKGEAADQNQTESKMTKQEKKDKNREKRRIARAKRESLKDFQAPKRIVLGFSCVVKKINGNAVKAVFVDPELPKNLLQILHPLALQNSLPVIGIDNLGMLTKKILGFKVRALGLSDHSKSCSPYSKLLESVLEVDSCQTFALNVQYQKTKLE